MNVGELRAQHERIMRLAAELRRAVDRSEERQPVAALRWGLARELIAHLAVEDRLLYPAILKSSDAAAVSLAARFKSELGGLSDAFTAYMTQWTDSRIAREWEDFCHETRTILDLLARRVARETESLYPLLEDVAEQGLPALSGARAIAARPHWPAA